MDTAGLAEKNLFFIASVSTFFRNQTSQGLEWGSLWKLCAFTHFSPEGSEKYVIYFPNRFVFFYVCKKVQDKICRGLSFKKNQSVKLSKNLCFEKEQARFQNLSFENLKFNHHSRNNMLKNNQMQKLIRHKSKKIKQTQFNVSCLTPNLQFFPLDICAWLNYASDDHFEKPKIIAWNLWLNYKVIQ